MRIVVLGRLGGIIRWTENVADAFRADGHDVRLLATRNPLFSKSVEQALLAERFGAPLAAWIARAIRKFAPELILTIAADRCPPIILETISAMPNRAPLISWTGDVFDRGAVDRLGCCDVVGYTDTGLLALHRQLGVRARGEFVPHAATLRGRPGRDDGPRVAQLAFVGQRTAERVGVLAQVRSPVALYGPEWGGAPEVAHHAPHSRRVQPDELAAIYARHMAVLNMRNEQYVLHGLNQRSFEPYAFGTPVVSDAQPDLPLCFDPGREVLVYRDAAQLNEIYDALRGDMAWAVEVGRRGQQRVLAQHLYSHRLATFRSFI